MWNKVRSRPRYDSYHYGLKSGKVMNQATLVRDLKQLEEMTCICYYGTNCFLHVSRIRELAENGFYHLEGKK